MEKYIVKNCPCLGVDNKNTPTCFDLSVAAGTKQSNCKDRTDCIIKQIYDYTDDIRENYSKHSMGELDVACNINDKFEIEEY